MDTGDKASRPSPTGRNKLWDWIPSASMGYPDEDKVRSVEGCTLSSFHKRWELPARRAGLGAARLVPCPHTRPYCSSPMLTGLGWQRDTMQRLA